MQDHAGVQVFNLGNGQGFTVLEVIEAAPRATGASIACTRAAPRG